MLGIVNTMPTLQNIGNSDVCIDSLRQQLKSMLKIQSMYAASAQHSIGLPSTAQQDMVTLTFQ